MIVLWTGKDVYVGFWTTLFLGSYAISNAITNLSCNVANGCNFTRHIYVIAMVEAILSLAVSYYGTKWIGIPGVALGRLVSALLFTNWAYPLWVKKHSSNKFQMSFRNVLPDLYVLLLFTIICGLIQFYVQIAILKNILGGALFISYIVIGWKIMDKRIQLYILSNLKQLIDKLLNIVGIQKPCKSSVIVDTGKN